jgi:hypothetical protein
MIKTPLDGMFTFFSGWGFLTELSRHMVFARE